MKRRAWPVVIVFVFLSLLAVQPAHGQALGTNFTYQGQLKNAGLPLNGTVDLEFKLWVLATGGVVVGTPNLINNVNVVDGLFTVSLDFGTFAFNGSQRWLEVAVRSPAGSGSFTTLSPRQPMTATPYALHALSGGPWTTSGNNIFNTNTGNVGIGTNAPSSKLDIQASNGSNVLFGRRTGGGLAHNMYIDSAGNGSMQLIDSANTPRVEFANGLTYFNYGNVGIGTTAPAMPLHVADDEPVMILQDTGSAQTQSGYLGFWNNGPSETAWVGFGSPGSPNFSVVNNRVSGKLQFLTVTGEGLIIQPGGQVSIGSTLAPLDTRLYVLASSDSAAVFARSNNGMLVGFSTSAGPQGSISVSGSTVSYNGFMGSHYGWSQSADSIERGALVRMTGENRRLNDSAESDVVYGIELAGSANDPTCLGAYLGIMEPDKSVDLANPHLIAAVGNGEMLVADSGTGDIKPGDYLISADVAGCAMKDDPKRFPIGHVVARAAQRIDWSAVTPDPNGRRIARMSVFFESFMRNGTTIRRASDAGEFDIESLRSENDGLRARIEALEQLVGQLVAARRTGATK